MAQCRGRLRQVLDWQTAMESALAYSITGMLMGKGGWTAFRFRTNSPLAALALLQTERSLVLVTDTADEIVPECELIRAAAENPAGVPMASRERLLT